MPEQKIQKPPTKEVVKNDIKKWSSIPSLRKLSLLKAASQKAAQTESNLVNDAKKIIEENLVKYNSVPSYSPFSKSVK